MSHCGSGTEIGGQQVRQGAQRAVHVRKGLALASAADQRVASQSVVRIHRRRRPHTRRRTGNQKPCGMTPTTVRATPPSCSGLPTMFGSRPNSSHNEWLSKRPLGAEQILALPERSPQHRRRAEDVEQLRGNGDAGNQPQWLACGFERQVFGPIRAHSFETRKVRAQPEELLLVPRPAEPEHASPLPFAIGNGSRIICSRYAVDGSRSTRAKRKRGDGKRRIERPAHEPSHRVASVDDPALVHGSSRPKPVGVRLESSHAAPPAPAEKCRRGTERLTPRPAAGGGLAVRAAATLKLSGQLGQDLVPLGDR